MKAIKIILSGILAVMCITFSFTCAAEIGDNEVIDDFGTLYGDVNDDGEVNIKDLVRLKKYAVGSPDSRINYAAGNLSAEDAVINSQDFILLRQLLLKVK